MTDIDAGDDLALFYARVMENLTYVATGMQPDEPRWGRRTGLEVLEMYAPREEAETLQEALVQFGMPVGVEPYNNGHARLLISVRDASVHAPEALARLLTSLTADQQVFWTAVTDENYPELSDGRNSPLVPGSVVGAYYRPQGELKAQYHDKLGRLKGRDWREFVASLDEETAARQEAAFALHAALNERLGFQQDGGLTAYGLYSEGHYLDFALPPEVVDELLATWLAVPPADISHLRTEEREALPVERIGRALRQQVQALAEMLGIEASDIRFQFVEQNPIDITGRPEHAIPKEEQIPGRFRLVLEAPYTELLQEGDIASGSLEGEQAVMAALMRREGYHEGGGELLVTGHGGEFARRSELHIGFYADQLPQIQELFMGNPAAMEQVALNIRGAEMAQEKSGCLGWAGRVITDILEEAGKYPTVAPF